MVNLCSGGMKTGSGTGAGAEMVNEGNLQGLIDAGHEDGIRMDPNYGNYLVVLLRSPDGSWKKYSDCTNDDPAP